MKRCAFCSRWFGSELRWTSFGHYPDILTSLYYGASNKREGTHVAAYSRRGVGLHARRPGESTTTVPILEHLRAGEGAFSQPYRRSHQARRSYAHKGGKRGGPHRGRPYGQRTPKRCLGHLRVQIGGGAHRREEMAPIFEDPAFNIRVVQRPFHGQSGGEFLGLEPA